MSDEPWQIPKMHIEMGSPWGFVQTFAGKMKKICSLAKSQKTRGIGVIFGTTGQYQQLTVIITKTPDFCLLL